jgi:hypothetical protein
MINFLAGPFIIKGILSTVGSQGLRISIYKRDIKKGPFASVILKAQNLKTLSKEINPLFIALV